MNNINDKIDKMFDEFQGSKQYQDYLKVRSKLLKNDDVMKLINDIKRLQKIEANNLDNSVKEQIEALYKRLESYPLYQSYVTLSQEIKEELFMVKEQFEKYFNNMLKLNI